MTLQIISGRACSGRTAALIKEAVNEYSKGNKVIVLNSEDDFFSLERTIKENMKESKCSEMSPKDFIIVDESGDDALTQLEMILRTTENKPTVVMIDNYINQDKVHQKLLSVALKNTDKVSLSVQLSADADIKDAKGLETITSSFEQLEEEVNGAIAIRSYKRVG